MIRILTVCTGNICRSPYAELYLQGELNRISPGSFTVRSAGTHALVGHAMDKRASVRLNEAGVSSEGFLAKQLTSQSTSIVDLVLALTEDHRENIVALNPRLLKRTYTIREFAAIIDEIATQAGFSFAYGTEPATVNDRWVSLLQAAPLIRHTARISLDGNLDVVDPYRQSDALYDQMVDELLPTLKVISNFERQYSTGQ